MAKYTTKKVTVDAELLVEPQLVQQFEGTQIGQPGMYLVTTEGGAKYLYTKPEFEALYQARKPTNGDPTRA